MYLPFDCDAMHAGARYSAAPTERQRAAQALRTLVDLPFRESVCKDGPLCVYTGKTTVSQMDRLHYLARECDMVLRNQMPGDAASKEIHQICLDRCGNLEKLEELARKEPARRASEAEAADHLTNLTGSDWVWDGLGLSTPLPSQDSPMHQRLTQLKFSGVFEGENALAVFSTHSPGGMTHWLTAHAVNLPRLQTLAASRSMGMSLS